MQRNNKPEIYIGYANAALQSFADEVALGIEEEGCLYREYLMSSDDDIKYSSINVAIVITDQTGRVLLNEIRKNEELFIINSLFNETARLLGKNAARYLKGMKLIMEKEGVL